MHFILRTEVDVAAGPAVVGAPDLESLLASTAPPTIPQERLKALGYVE